MEDTNLELEMMRSQIDTLKQHLDKQEIVSDQLIRGIARLNTKDIRYTKRMVFGAAAFCIVIYPISALTHIWSPAFAIATCVMMLFCVVGTYVIHRPVEQLNLMNDDLATVARVMSKFKKDYDNWLRYVTPTLLIPWLGWACYEMAWKNAPAGSNPLWLILPLLVGAAIGGLIGYRYHRKAVDAAQNILDQIEEA